MLGTFLSTWSIFVEQTKYSRLFLQFLFLHFIYKFCFPMHYVSQGSFQASALIKWHTLFVVLKSPRRIYGGSPLFPGSPRVLWEDIHGLPGPIKCVWRLESYGQPKTTCVGSLWDWVVCGNSNICLDQNRYVLGPGPDVKLMLRKQTTITCYHYCHSYSWYHSSQLTPS